MQFEAEVLPGLKPFAVDEMIKRLHTAIRVDPDRGGEDAVPLFYEDDPADLHRLRTVVAIYRVLHFDVPRPRALLGHEHLSRLLEAVNEVQEIHPPGAFESFRFSAAGKQSEVFGRLRQTLNAQTGLMHDPEDAHLFLRVRPAVIQSSGWEVLIRTTPRPLSARGWRVCDMPGALNATIASAMIELTDPQPDDWFLNIMCGSGTLIVERLVRSPAEVAAGCDIDEAALRCAHQNLRAAGYGDRVELAWMDAAQLDVPDASFSKLIVDLPWGQLVGSHIENETLYPAVLRESARVTVPGGYLVVITHEVALFESLLTDFMDAWVLARKVRVFQGGLHPRIYQLRRI